MIQATVCRGYIKNRARVKIRFKRCDQTWQDNHLDGHSVGWESLLSKLGKFKVIQLKRKKSGLVAKDISIPKVKCIYSICLVYVVDPSALCAL